MAGDVKNIQYIDISNKKIYIDSFHLLYRYYRYFCAAISNRKCQKTKVSVKEGDK